MKLNNKIDELIERFDRVNGNSRYSEKDLLKYLISRVDDIDDKINKANEKLDNHVTTISQRITSIETSISNFKWFFGGGVILALLISLLSIILKTWIWI